MIKMALAIGESFERFNGLAEQAMQNNQSSDFESNLTKFRERL